MAKYALLHKHGSYYLQYGTATSKAALRKKAKTMILNGYRIVPTSRVKIARRIKGQPLLYKVEKKTRKREDVFSRMLKMI